MKRPVAIVTGGGRGIGAATSLLAAARGYAVVVNYRERADAASEVVDGIRAAGGEAIAVQADVAVEAEVVGLFGAAAQAFGAPAALVNNAGIVAPQSRLEAMTAERLRRMFEVNVLGAFLCAREAVRAMSTRNGGAGGTIVNVSSAASRLGSPGEYVDYAASKGALETLTVGLAREVAADGVRVAAVRAGIIDTGIHASGGDPERARRLAPALPAGRAGTADEVAKAILWLLSDEASYSTGAIVDVAGGR
jgi:NAD(P)-dependent dehydrogenase (short-subunit alcohol dehydrogenase family)